MGRDQLKLPVGRSRANWAQLNKSAEMGEKYYSDFLGAMVLCNERERENLTSQSPVGWGRRELLVPKEGFCRFLFGRKMLLRENGFWLLFIAFVHS